MEITELTWPLRVLILLPVYVFQILIVLSELALIIFIPSGEKHTLLTYLLWPYKVSILFPVYASHILIVVSELPLIIFVPLGE